jgi:hypothetical protein
LTKLINSYLWRLFRNKLLYVGLAAAFIITLAGAGTESSSEQSMLMIKALSLGIIAFTSVFVPLFLGREYSDRTIRNKFISGYTRTQVFFASCTAVAVVEVLMTASWLAGAAIAVHITGAELSELLSLAAKTFLFSMAHAAFVTFFSMLISKTAVCIAVQILIFHLFSSAAPIMLAIGVNIGGTAERVSIYAASSFPMGQWFSAIGFPDEVSEIGAYRAAACVALMLLFTAAGCIMFRKKSIR